MEAKSNLAKGTIIHQWTDVTDYEALANAMDFVFIRTGDGLNEDPLFKKHWDSLEGLPIERATFHIFRENLSARDMSLKYLQIMKSVSDEIPAILCWDVETNAQISNIAARENLQEAFFHLWWHTSRWATIYTSEYFSEMLMNVYSHPPNWFSDIDLWVADYSKWPPRLPDGFIKAEFVQTNETSVVPGIKNKVTEDLFTGTPEEFAQYVLRKKGQASNTQPGTPPNPETGIAVAKNKANIQKIIAWIESF